MKDEVKQQIYAKLNELCENEQNFCTYKAYAREDVMIYDTLKAKNTMLDFALFVINLTNQP